MSTIHLIFVSALVMDMNAVIIFTNIRVSILDSNSSTLLALGPFIPGQHLYTLDLQAALAEHTLTAI